jgi:hypothetical protein
MQRAHYWAGTLHPQRAAALESLPGWHWSGNHQRKWHRRFAALSRYARANNASEIPVDATIDGLRIGAWATAQRAACVAGTLPARGEPARRNGGLVVSTQALEVSLCLDFDRGVTKLAPVEALAQRAGRVNRRGRHPQGQVEFRVHTTVESPRPYQQGAADAAHQASLRAQSATFGTSTSGHPRPEDPIESDPDPGPGQGSCRDLLESLRTVIDPRRRRGIRHRLVSILALAAAAVVAGARPYVAAGQWAANAPAGVLGALEVRVHPRTGRYVVPCESTIRRTLQACDGDQLDAVLGAWLYPRLDTEQVIVQSLLAVALGASVVTRDCCAVDAEPTPIGGDARCHPLAAAAAALALGLQGPGVAARRRSRPPPCSRPLRPARDSSGGSGL